MRNMVVNGRGCSLIKTTRNNILQNISNELLLLKVIALYYFSEKYKG